MAGAMFNESDLQNSDFSAADNMDAVRFDESTIWPETDMLPEDFDTTYTKDFINSPKRSCPHRLQEKTNLLYKLCQNPQEAYQFQAK